MKRVLCLLLFARGCTCGAPAPASTPPSGASPNANAPAVSAPAAAPESPADCDVRWGYHGTVAGKEVFLRLDRTHGTLAGRYFYAKVGVDLALSGTLDASGGIALVEGEPGKPTGHFEGICRSGSGALDGTWSNASRSYPFHLERVGPRETPLVATKRFALTRKAKHAGASGGTGCKYEQETVELFGAGSPEAELALRHQDATQIAPWIASREDYDAVLACDTPVDASASESVTGIFRGLVTIQRGGTSMYDGAAHPNNGVDFERVTYDLATGAAVTASEVFATLPEALVKRCVAGYGAHPELLQIDGHELALVPQGVHVFGAGYPHFAAALTGQGPILTWAALLREGALRADSPVKRAWEGVAPAKPGDAECLDDSGPPRGR